MELHWPKERGVACKPGPLLYYQLTYIGSSKVLGGLSVAVVVVDHVKRLISFRHFSCAHWGVWGWRDAP